MNNLINFELPYWYPALIPILFLIVYMLHRNKYHVTNNFSKDKMLSCLAYILLFASELLYIIAPSSRSFFYYMDYDIVGWPIAIIAFLLTIIIFLFQYILYIKFSFKYLFIRPLAYTNLIIQLYISIISVMVAFNIFDEFIEEHMDMFTLPAAAIMTLIVIIQNIINRSYLHILIQIPLVLLSLIFCG